MPPSPAPATGPTDASARGVGTGVVLLTLATGQFLMALDSSVMNVAIATVAEDVGTTVTGIQTAITLYTLVMAALMIPGGKVGALIGHRRAFSLGCVIYAAGSLTTALAPNYPTLIIGWAFLEGIGAALILPAIVALVAGNFAPARRPAAYGLIAAAAAVAIAVGPLIGGLATTYFSWRWVFAGEVVLVIGILILGRRIHDTPPPEHRQRIDLVGAVMCASGLTLVVFGVLRIGEWGFVEPKDGAPTWFGISPVLWLICGGLFVIWLLFRWEAHVAASGREPLVRPEMFRNRQLTGGLTMFFFQYSVQAGIFFVTPLYLSVALGLSAIETGVRLVPLSVTLLIAAVGIPKVFPRASPRRVARVGLLAMLAGTLVLIGGLSPDSGPEIVLVPMLLIGLGIGALASQLGAVTVSAVPTSESAEVGGVQNTVTNLGSSLGTALAGSLLIGALSSAFLANIAASPAIPDTVKANAQVELAGGIPFVSDADLEEALDDAGLTSEATQAALDANADARLEGLRAGLAILALLALAALFLSGRMPRAPPGSEPEPEPQPA